MSAINNPQDYIDTLSPHRLLRAKLLSSHLLLPDGAVVYDMGSYDGGMTAALAALNPYLKFIGVDRNKGMVKAASDRFDFDNLSFIHADVTAMDDIAPNVADAIINSRILGEIYTRTGYNPQKVQDAIENQFRILKEDGIYLLYDYIMKPEDEYVLMEFPVIKGTGFKTRANMKGKDIAYQGERDCDSLIWYAQNARPAKQQDETFRGFFLEELPAARPFTRLFRLPHKWAYEFTLRMDNGDVNIDAAGGEFSCLTEEDYVRVMERNYARIHYTRPWRNPMTKREIFTKRFRLYHDDADMTPMPFPDTGFVMVAQKTAEGRVLKMSERRPSASDPDSLMINTIRDEVTGDMFDLAAPATHKMTVIPFLFNADTGLLKIALKKSRSLTLTTAVMRSGYNIDNRRWSGHNLTPLQIEPDHIDETATGTMMHHFGMRVSIGSKFLEGPKGFPAPDMIEDYVETLYVELSKDQPEWHKDYKLVDAERILRAVNAGYIPDAWLEVQIETLMRHCGVERQPWMHEEMPIGKTPPPDDMILDVDKIFKWNPDAAQQQLENYGKKKEDTRFRAVKGKAGQLRAKRSVFVGEGRHGATKSGLVSREYDFILPQDGVINRAAILFLTADMKGEVLVGFEYEEMPAPYRLGVKDKMINVPSMDLPKNIANIDEAKAFLASKFETSPDRVAQMGESFMTMKDMTPQRTYLFAVGSAPCEWMGKRTKKYAPVSKLWKFEPDFKWSMLFCYGFGYLLQSLDGTAHSPGYEARLTRDPKKFGQLKAVGTRGTDGTKVNTNTHQHWFKRGTGNDNGKGRERSLRPYQPPKKNHG